jgi:hypothetical protein
MLAKTNEMSFTVFIQIGYFLLRNPFVAIPTKPSTNVQTPYKFFGQSTKDTLVVFYFQNI